MYWLLHKMHQVALNDWFKITFSTCANIINSPNRSTIKLH